MILTKEQIIRLNAKIFADKTSEILLELDIILPQLREHGGELQLIRTLYRAMSAFRGAGRMFGFAEMARLADAVMSALEPPRNGDHPVSPALAALVTEAIQHMHLMLATAIREGESNFFTLGAGNGGDGDGGQPIDFDTAHVEYLILALQDIPPQ